MEKQLVNGNSYFIRDQKTQKQFEYLNENIECDVLIIGGGVTGAILSYYFSTNHINTVVLEKNRIGHGSTSVTTALLQYELDDNAKPLEAILGKENVIKSYQLGSFALNQLQNIMNEYGNSCYYKIVDSLLYTNKSSQCDEIKNEYLFRKSQDFDVSWVDQSNNPYDFDLKACICSNQNAATLDPYLFTYQLLDIALKHHCRIYENSAAIKISYEEDKVIVETNYGHIISCKKVIVATGYDIDLFTNKKLDTKYLTFNIVTKPLENINPLLYNVIARDNEDPYHYFRMTHDHRMIIGGEDIPYEAFNQNEKIIERCYQKLEQMACQILNQKIKIDYKYHGVFGTTKDTLGYLDQDPKHENLWYCLGYGANGILYAILGGYFLVQKYLGKSNELLELFKIKR